MIDEILVWTLNKIKPVGTIQTNLYLYQKLFMTQFILYFYKQNAVFVIIACGWDRYRSPFFENNKKRALQLRE